MTFWHDGACTTPTTWMSVTGFTGQVSTAGLVEFASRTYDPSTRVWLQDDSFRGTTTRASSEPTPLSLTPMLGGTAPSVVDPVAMPHRLTTQRMWSRMRRGPVGWRDDALAALETW